MKSAVLDDGLLLMAFSAVGTLRHGALGQIPLLVQNPGPFVIAAAVGALASLGRPRPSDVVLRTTLHEVTSVVQAGPRQCFTI